ncbi:Calcineurin-like phosphoesterase superfamily domain protein [uncultured archaeon]|nr:Calcineurin-like phosphoesterase superfamily domain protein [uncultured archaeon]
MAYIVVSDVHLGSDSSNQSEFCDFLEWVRGLNNQSKKVNYNDSECKDSEVTIIKPEKMVLLGDILELWDPKDGNRDNVIMQGMKPFSILSEADFEKIYVVGNHDDSLGELEDYVNFVALPNGTKFEVHDSHYPEADKQTGIPRGFNAGKGDRKYFFLHGQQFDKEQDVLKKVSSLLGEKWDPIAWFQSLFNITYTKKHWVENLIAFLILFVGGMYGLEKLVLPRLLNSLNVVFFILILVMLYFGCRYFWNYILSSYLKSNFYTNLTNLIWVGLVIAGAYYSWSYYLLHQPSQFTYIVIWAAGTGYFAISSIPGVVVHLQRIVYDMIKSKDKTVEEIINSGYYKKNKDTIDADVVVFGHTHFAGSYGPNADIGNKTFINTGCWIGKDDVINGKQRYANTFVYIDGSGAYIMKWLGCGNIRCIEAFPEVKSGNIPTTT